MKDITKRIDVLRKKHRILDEQIAMLRNHTFTDDTQIVQLKKKKLRIKDEINLLKHKTTVDTQ